MKEKYEQLTTLEEKEGALSASDFEILEKISYDLDEGLRANVARILVDSSGEQSRKFLFRLANDTIALVRIEACDSLCNEVSEDTYELLKKKIQMDRNSLVRGYAVASLADVGVDLGLTKETERFLRNHSEKEIAIFTRIQLYAALCLLGNSAFLDKLLAMLNTKNYSNRCATIHSLVAITSNVNVEEISNALKERMKCEKTHAVRSTIENSLAKIGQSSQYEILREVFI